jgi:hypothetical protein
MFFSRISGDSSRSIGAEQKANLGCRNDKQQSGEDSKDKCVKRDRVFPRPIPNYRQPLPEGFGYFMIFAGGIGVTIGLLYVLILWRWNRDGGDRPKARRQ